MTLLAQIVAVSDRVAKTSSRTGKMHALAECIRQLSVDEIEIGVLFLAGEMRQGKLGVGFNVLREARDVHCASEPALQLADVDRAFTDLATIRGTGSSSRRAVALRALFASATREEQHLLVRLLVGELRQGALAGVMIEAIAKAAEVPIQAVRRAAMYAKQLGHVARAALGEGPRGLAAFQLEPLSPVAPMLAQTAADVAGVLEALDGEIAFEWKVDGARIQVHKESDLIRVYTRSLNDVTAAVPEIVQLISKSPAYDLVLDGEAIALDAAGNPRPFQVTMRRFGRKLDVETLRKELPLHAYFFDCLRCNGRSLADAPAHERFAALAGIVPEAMRVPRIVTRDFKIAEEFYAQALLRGHEGVMAKTLDAPYEAGNRGASWLKIKRAHTLDLVVIAAEWGHGRRSGKLSNLHLAARDPRTDEYVMLGKTFKGLTDALLEWQTEQFLSREVSRDEWTVYVRPELVVEIAFNDIQASSHYPAGRALRFARVKRYREDKAAEQADSIDTVRKLYQAQGVSAASLES
jgi:DNA ligase-1